MQTAGWPAPVDEPLAASAGLARQWAARHCPRDHAGSSCECYHGLWQYLRLMQLGKTLSGQAALYLQALEHLGGQWGDQGGPAVRHVLISGCADYSMLAHLLQVFHSGPARPRITALDRCPTPLALNGWYAEWAETSVELVCEDILAHRPAVGYDLIVTSGFLGYFSPDMRPGLFELYAGMLRPGGQLVFSNRLRAAPEDSAVGFTAEQATTFANKVARLSLQLPAIASLAQTDAYDLAYAYATTLESFPVNSADTVRRLAQRAGLRWMPESQVGGTAHRSGANGPTLADGSDYLFAVLEK